MRSDSGTKQDKILEIAELAKIYLVDIKFIELMPIGYGKKYHSVSKDEIMNMLNQTFGSLVPFEQKRGNGPASYYRIEHFKGAIGFISAVTHGFCDECSRIRLTCDGTLKLCLHYNKGISLKEHMRNGVTDQELKELIKDAVYSKPMSHNFNGQEEADWEDKKMFQIGG